MIDSHAVSFRSSGFTFLELLTTIAALVILIGLMVSLARYVRATSADQITRQTLLELDAAINRPGSPATQPDFMHLPSLSGGNDEAAVAMDVAESNVIAREMLGMDKPVLDAWGRPIGYLASQDPRIGMAPGNRAFCFSAGADGRYLTRSDNLYTYEQPRRFAVGVNPSTQPVDKPNN